MPTTLRERSEALDTVFAALADPTRRAILTQLAHGEASVNELARPFTISQPAVSQHLKVLERAGLISRARRGTARLSRLEAEPLREATTWLARYREFWEESYERLDELLATLQGGADPAREPQSPAKRPATKPAEKPEGLTGRSTS